MNPKPYRQCLSPRRIPAQAARRAAAVPVLLCATLLSGCLDDLLLSDDSPGVYKGRQDPLMAQPAEQRDAALGERLQLIQNRQ